MAMSREIPLKTDASYNPNDFIRTECGTMKELTVTITLAEYRELVSKVHALKATEERAWHIAAERSRERDKLEKENKGLCAEIEQMRRDFTAPLEDWTKEEPDA